MAFWRRTAKRFVPKALIHYCVWLAGFAYHKYYLLRYGPMFIRKGTTDSEVFQAIFIRRNYYVPVDIDPRLIIDGGAYVGYSSIYFSLKYPKAKIIAVEPNDSNFEILEKNTRTFPNIQRIKAGLWYRNAPLKISDVGFGHWAYRTEEAEETEASSLQGITVSSLLADSGLDRVDILKLDIEGAEKKIFAYDCEAWLRRVNILAAEIHDDCKPLIDTALHKGNWAEYQSNDVFIFVNQDAVGIKSAHRAPRLTARS
jgi:FkbM family methyltransferase